MLRLLIRFGLVRFFPQNFCYTTLPLHPLQAFYGWVIPSLSELCTQLHNAQVRVLPVHVGSEFAFLLVGHAGWMPMRPVGLADQGWAGPVVAAKPEVDVGPGVVRCLTGLRHISLQVPSETGGTSYYPLHEA